MQQERDLTRVYVAGSYLDARIQYYIRRVNETKGCVVTHDWTQVRALPPHEAALRDLEGVRDSDYVIAVMDYKDTHYDYRGTFTELGAAIALDKRVIVVCAAQDAYARSNCFYWHPRIVYVTHFDVALRLLRASEPNLMVLGHGGHGKDTLTESLVRRTGMRFASSSEAANRVAVYPTLRERYGYASEQECFDDRRNHRLEWHALIRAYNGEDRARLAREIMRDNDIYVGMRDAEEFEAARPLFDFVVWVDAAERLPELDPSLFIAREQADVIVPNNGTLEEFEARIAALAHLFMPLLEKVQ